MAYSLQAILGKCDVLEDAARGFPTVVIGQSTLMIPLKKSLREERGIPLLPLTDEGEHVLPTAIQSLCAELSRHGRIAYVEAEFFGGDGMQAAVLAEGGRIIGEPEVSLMAINAALSFIGVKKGEHEDEFEAVGLGGKRSTEDW